MIINSLCLALLCFVLFSFSFFPAVTFWLTQGEPPGPVTLVPLMPGRGNLFRKVDRNGPLGCYVLTKYCRKKTSGQDTWLQPCRPQAGLKLGPSRAQAGPKLAPSQISGNLDIWDLAIWKFGIQTNLKNTNSQNQNLCRPKCRQGLDE